MASKVAYIIVEVNALLALGAFSAYLYFFLGITTWFNRQITCNDPNFSKHFINWDDELIPDFWIYIILFAYTPVAVLYDGCLHSGKKNINSSNHCSEKKLFCKSIRSGFYLIGLYLSGVFMLCIFIKFSQLLGGSPAPYFLTLCGLDCSTLNENGSFSSLVLESPYTTSTRCTSKFTNLMKPETLSSFPSLHSAVTAYATSFLIIVSVTVKTQKTYRLLLPCIIIASSCSTFLVIITMWNENRNHLIDLVAGGVIGFAAACVQKEW